MTDQSDSPKSTELADRLLRFGWRSLLVFLVLGIVLEALLGFKVDWYLDVANEARRTVWRLAHAHGALLSIVSILYGLTLRTSASLTVPRTELISKLLLGGIILLPGGFFLGGLFIYDGDPGLGIFLAPIGALALFLAVYLICRSPVQPCGKRR